MTSADQILIDFVAGSHGHFLEIVLNKYFGIVDINDTFTNIGTSHKKSWHYERTKLFAADHYYRWPRGELKKFNKIISIRFDQDDLLLLSSVSLLRSSDLNIDDRHLEIDTRNKLNHPSYQHLLDKIDSAYVFLDREQSSIPRNVLREFFKFGFANPDVNGLWLEQKSMCYHPDTQVFDFQFKSFYDIDLLVAQIKNLQQFVNMQFDFSDDFYQHHQTFLKYIPYVNHKKICDHILACVQSNIDVEIPALSLFQESYINGNLERIYQKEMPFHSIDYFKSTADVLYYIKNQAPNL